MAKKQWETVMLSKETKEKLKELKGKQSYEAFIDVLLTNHKQNNSSSSIENIDTERLISDYLEPMKAYMAETTPSAELTKQTQQLIEEYNQMEEELERAKKRINVLTQDNDRLKKKRR